MRSRFSRNAIFWAAFVVLIFWSAARANEYLFGDSTVIANERPVLDDLTVAGNNVQIRTPIQGDVMAAGASVTVAGRVAGDVIAAGANINIEGSVTDDLRAVGSNIIVTGPISDNVMLAGANIVLGPKATIGRDADLAGSTVMVQGSVKRHLKVAAGEARLDSNVGGNVEAHSDKLILMPDAQIHGKLVIYGANPPVISPGAKVLGGLDFHHVMPGKHEGSGGALGWIFGWLVRFAWLMAVGATALGLSRLWVDRVSEVAAHQGGRSLLTGFIFLVTVPLAIFFLTVTLIGIPVAALLLAAHVIVMLLSGAFVAHMAGAMLLQCLHRTATSPYKQLAIGAFALSFLMVLPWVGWLVQFLVLSVGFGAFVLERWEFRDKLRTDGLA